MYEKTTGLQATIKYLGGIGNTSVEKLVTNPQAGDRAQAANFGAQIFAGDQSQTIIPWGSVIGAIKTEFVDVYLKMDQESEQYVLCPLDEVEAAIAAIAAQEAQAAADAEAVAQIAAAVKDSPAESRIITPGLEVVTMENIENPYTSDEEAQDVADIGGEG